MAYHLHVVSPFDEFHEGDIIKDKARVEKILASHHAMFVRKVWVNDPPPAPRPVYVPPIPPVVTPSA